MITQAQREEMRKAAEAATPGEWFTTGSPWFRDSTGVLAGSPDGNIAFVIADCEAIGSPHVGLVVGREDRVADCTPGDHSMIAVRNAQLTGDWGCFVCERVVDPVDFVGPDAACPHCGRSDGLREMTTDDLAHRLDEAAE